MNTVRANESKMLESASWMRSIKEYSDAADRNEAVPFPDLPGLTPEGRSYLDTDKGARLIQRWMAIFGDSLTVLDTIDHHSPTNQRAKGLATYIGKSVTMLVAHANECSRTEE